MSVNIDIENVIPSDYLLANATSTSRAILRKSQVRIQPIEQTTFTPKGTRHIRFVVSSNTDICLMNESYFEFRMTLDSQADAPVFDKGGFHCAIKRLEVSASNTGARIMSIDNYNRYFSLMSQIFHSEDFVEKHGCKYGDSKWLVESNSTSGPHTYTNTSGNIAMVNATSTVTGLDVGLQELIQPGDLIVLEGYTYEVATWASATSLTTTDSNNDGVAHATDTIIIIKSGKNRRNDPHNSTGVSEVITFRPFAAIFDHALPLFLMRNGILIDIELEFGSRCLIPTVGLSAAKTAPTYTISNPRFVGMMSTAHREIQEEMVAQWQTTSGLMYYIPSVLTLRTQLAATSQDSTIQLNAGVRSARRVFAIVQDSKVSEGDNEQTYRLGAISRSLRSKIRTFQLQVGTSFFPLTKVDCEFGTVPAIRQLRTVVGDKMVLRDGCDVWEESYPFLDSAKTGISTQSKFFPMAFDLSKDMGPHSALTGVDLSHVPMQLIIERSDTYNNATDALEGNPIYYIFVEYDSWLHLTSEQTVVIR